jgi:hypothetical protein
LSPAGEAIFSFLLFLNFLFCSICTCNLFFRLVNLQNHPHKYPSRVWIGFDELVLYVSYEDEHLLGIYRGMCGGSYDFVKMCLTDFSELLQIFFGTLMHPKDTSLLVFMVFFGTLGFFNI